LIALESERRTCLSGRAFFLEPFQTIRLTMNPSLVSWVRRGLLAAVISLVPLCAGAQFDKQAWPAKTPSPVLNMQDLQGRTWTSATLKGRVVVLNFWATWCAPCKEEMPTLQDLHDSPQAPVVIAVNVKEPKSRVQTFLNQRHLSLPVVLDERGDLARQWGVRVYPTTVLIAPDGQARWRVLGDLDWDGLQAESWIKDLQRPR
jgi:thiol-disulfide isomerase/thioredoxin